MQPQRPAFRVLGAAGGGGSGGGGGGGAAADEEEEEEGEGGGLYADLVIPDNLRTHLTDTAEERLRKRKRVKMLKQAHRLKKSEAVAVAATSNWKAFAANMGKKRARDT